MKSQSEMAVDAYYNVYIYTAQVRPFVLEGCALCYIHICNVGVGVSSCFLFFGLVFHGLRIPPMRKNIQGVMTPPAPILLG